MFAEDIELIRLIKFSCGECILKLLTTKTEKNKIPIKWSASKQQLYVVTKYTFVFIAAGFIAVS